MDSDNLNIPASGPVILVDDDDMELLLFRNFQELSLSQFELLTFSDGSHLLQHLDKVAAGQAEMPAAILLDANMPYMDGYELLQIIRARPEFMQSPKIVMFSNSKSDAEIEKALALGANAYQVKPADHRTYLEFFYRLFASD